MIPYDTETMRLLNPSTVAVRHFADLEYRPADREWVIAEASRTTGRERRPWGAWVSALVAYLSPK